MWAKESKLLIEVSVIDNVAPNTAIVTTTCQTKLANWFKHIFVLNMLLLAQIFTSDCNINNYFFNDFIFKKLISIHFHSQYLCCTNQNYNLAKFLPIILWNEVNLSYHFYVSIWWKSFQTWTQKIILFDIHSDIDVRSCE